MEKEDTEKGPPSPPRKKGDKVPTPPKPPAKVMKPKQSNLRNTFTPEELEEVLVLACQCGLTLLGGQAVNAWASLLESPNEEPWKGLRPYTSFDADLLAEKSKMLKLAQSLQSQGWKVNVFLPESKEEEKINTGALEVFWPQDKSRRLEINVLHRIEGLSIQEVEENATLIPLGKSQVRVLDPLRLLESKTISLNTLNQTTRQDRKHLELCVAIVHRILQENIKSPESHQAEATAQRIIKNALHDLGTSTWETYGINLLDAIPWKEWAEQKAHPSLTKIGKEENLHRQAMTEKCREKQELEAWLKTLNPPNKKPPEETSLSFP
jgi:hypothetical protein